MNGLVIDDLNTLDEQDLSTIQETSKEFSFRSYQGGDWKLWEEIVSASLHENGIEQAVDFDTLQRKNPLYKPELTFFLWEEDRVVATVSLQRDPAFFAEYGYRIIHLHSLPAGKEKRKKYLELISKLAIGECRKRRASSAWASGENERATQSLIKVGFKKTELTPTTFHQDHTDYGKRTKPMYRWHTHRMIGESTGNTGDARGDESLYKPSALGRAWCGLKTVYAGDDRPFELFFKAGPAGIRPGVTVKFWMPGQGSLGTAPQMEEPDFPGFVEVFPPRNVVVEPICSNPRVFSMETGETPPGGLKAGDLIVGPVHLGFTLVKGEMKEGDTVRISVGAEGGFRWKKLAQKKKFNVIIEPGEGEPKMRLPEPVVIHILPLKPDYLDVFLPGSAANAEEVRAVICARDRYENRVPVNGTVRVYGLDPLAAAEKKDLGTAYLSSGRGEFPLGKMEDTPIRIQCECSLDAEDKCDASQGGDVSARGGFEKPITGGSNICVPAEETEGQRVFFGDMHSHDFQSTAEGYPSDCYLWAREDKRLDFQSLPIQVHRWIDNEKWTIAKHMAEYFLEEGRFVTFLGFEWQHSAYGDKVVHYLGGDMPYLPVDDPRYAAPARLYEALRGADAFIISHHPGYALNLHVPGTRWETLENDVDRILEIWSMHGSSEGFQQADRPLIKPYRPGGVYEGLRQGVKMGLVGGSDTHTARPGGSVDDVRPYRGGLCAVWAEELTRRSLFEAFLARRTYALTDTRIVLRFSVNGAAMGSEIPFTEERKMAVSVWAPTPIKEVQFLKNTELWKVHSPNGKTSGKQIEIKDTDNVEERRGDFYHCRVVLKDGNLAVSSPVWISRS